MDDDKRSTDKRSIELEIEVAGTPEEVWRAVATGPGISSWYVPHDVEEREGGRANASFGPGPDMTVEGRVLAWEPPHRAVLGSDGLAFEWLVEAKDGGTCIVRLINTGFGEGGPWDDQYDGMTEGWAMFLVNLRLHLQHFGGQSATAALSSAMWPAKRDTAWSRLTNDLGIDPRPAVGDRVEVSLADAPGLTGAVGHVGSHLIILVTDAPAPGTAILAAEGYGDNIAMSVWLYLYGDEGEIAARRDEPLWTAWMEERSLPPVS